MKPRVGKRPRIVQPNNSQRPWQIVAYDIMGPFLRSWRGFLLAIINHFLKWIEFFPLQKLTACAIWGKFIEVFNWFGFPVELVSDYAS